MKQRKCVSIVLAHKLHLPGRGVQECISIYADIDNFTKYVADRINDDDSAKDVVKTLHVLRSELDAVLDDDFSGKKVRFIGDCIHGLLVEGIAHPDDIVRSRRSESAAPRDNVIFELGFFMSRLGRKRTILLVPQMDAELKLPSDFKGLTPITYSPLTGSVDEIPGRVLADPIYVLEQKIQQLGCREL